jgi:hypothetical protein
LEWTGTSFEQHLAEFYTIFLEGHLQITLEMLEVGIRFSYSPIKLARVVQLCSNLVILLVRVDIGVHLHALQTMTEDFQSCERGHCCLGILKICIFVRK